MAVYHIRAEFVVDGAEAVPVSPQNQIGAELRSDSCHFMFSRDGDKCEPEIIEFVRTEVVGIESVDDDCRKDQRRTVRSVDGGGSDGHLRLYR